MKRKELFGGVLTLLMVSIVFSPMNLNAQDEASDSPFSVGGDLVSSYLWRGTKFGTGPAIQPYLEVALGNLAIGGWGSYCFTSNEAAEADLYISYGFDFGLSLGLTDYYFPGTEYFDYTTATGSHAFEVNLGYEIGGLAIGANMFLNEAGGAGTAGQDLYFELAYSFTHFGVFVGGGNGWHTVEADADESDFMVCNIGVTASKEIKFTENFSLPVSGSLILNPDTEQFHVVVGVSF
jgi:hypothetical protein